MEKSVQTKFAQHHVTNKYKRWRAYVILVRLNDGIIILQLFLLLEKGGIEKADVLNVYDHVTTKCQNLKIIGLMTIGSLDSSLNVDKELNGDFLTLINLKKEICTKFNVNPQDLELSMGMSHDFEQAVSTLRSSLGYTTGTWSSFILSDF